VFNLHKLRQIDESRKKREEVAAKLLAELYRPRGFPELGHKPLPWRLRRMKSNDSPLANTEEINAQIT